MKKLLLISALAIISTLLASVAYAQTTSTDASAARPKQEQLIGEVTAIDASGQVTIKTEAGKTISFNTGDQTSYLRIAPGEKSLSNAAKITRADVKVGDRVLVSGGGTSADGQAAAVRRVIVVSKEALAQRDTRNEQDWRTRSINGRITALNPQTKEITIAARSRQGLDTIVINASGSNVKVLRYAPDSTRREDAQPSSFATLKVGDQLRALGDRSSDGTHFTPEEIIAGSFTRVNGTITNVDAAKGEVTIKDDQSGKSFVVAVSKNSTLHRLPADFVERMTKLREEAQQRRAAAAANGAQNNGQQGEVRNQRTAGNTERAGSNQGENGGPRGGGGPGGARGFQQLFEGMPAVTVADLKKGDGVMVNGTPSASDPSHITAITLTAGDAAIVKRLQQFQGRPGGQRNMSPGLPGDVVGGGTGGQPDRP
ncbi:MAG TPA: hypothetical protein VKB86_09780 [Pyrinomonadaceae bacterium]|nr:hypothetical protein [Pyrinomonadaceae bacterium]